MCVTGIKVLVVVYYDLLKRIAFCCGEHKMGKEFLEFHDVETEKLNFCYSKITIYVGDANLSKVVVSGQVACTKMAQSIYSGTKIMK